MKRLSKVVLVLGLIVVGILVVALVAGRHGERSTGLSLNIGKTETRNNTFSSATSSASENATFNSRRVLFIPKDSGGFSRRLAECVISGLTNCPQIDSVEIMRPGSAVSEGFRAPDIFVQLEVVGLTHSGIVSSKLNTRVEGSVGIAPWQSSHYSSSRTTPPTVQFAWNATVENESIFSGVRTDRYGETIRSIAAEFVKGASNQLASLSAKYPPLPELPRVFYGPYQSVKDFACLNEVKAKRVCSYYGLFSHNETFWEFQVATNAVPKLQHMIDELVSANWTLSDASLTNTLSPSVRLHQGDALLEIFRVDRPALSEEIPLGSAQFIARYSQPFSETEVEAALETLFAGQPSLETLMPFQNSFSSSQRTRYYAMLEKLPATRPQTCLQLAEVYAGRKQTNAAINMLIRAKALKSLVDDESDIDSRIESISKKLSPKQKLALEVTPEVCRDLAFLELTNPPQRLEAERELGQPLVWFSSGERGILTSSVLIHPPRRGICDWKFVQAGDNGRSSQWSSFDSARENVWRQSFDFNHQTAMVSGRLSSDGKRVAFTIETK